MLQSGKQGWQLFGLVRQIGVHLHEHAVVVREPPVESSQVGGPQPFLTLAVHDVDVFVCAGEPIGDLTGAVGGIVVGNEHVHLRIGGPQSRCDGLNVFCLVVGGDDHQDLSQICTHRFAGHDTPISGPLKYPSA